MKFKSTDERYLTRRTALSEKYGPRDVWSVADHWPLYVGIGNLSRFMAISDLLRGSLDVPGHVAEFGSWRGANLLFMAKLLEIHDALGQKIVHCFDSFEGLTTFVDQDGDAEAGTRGAYKGSLEELEDMIDLCELGDAIEIHKGLIQDTLPPMLSARPGIQFSFVYCDTDLYEPSKEILERMDPHLSRGGLFVFDQWNYDAWPGESLAVREFMDARGTAYRMESVRQARQPSLVLRKVAP
jgi:hypothetical protein